MNSNQLNQNLSLSSRPSVLASFPGGRGLREGLVINTTTNDQQHDGSSPSCSDTINNGTTTTRTPTRPTLLTPEQVSFAGEGEEGRVQEDEEKNVTDFLSPEQALSLLPLVLEALNLQGTTGPRVLYTQTSSNGLIASPPPTSRGGYFYRTPSPGETTSPPPPLAVPITPISLTSCLSPSSTSTSPFPTISDISSERSHPVAEATPFLNSTNSSSSSSSSTTTDDDEKIPPAKIGNAKDEFHKYYDLKPFKLLPKSKNFVMLRIQGSKDHSPEWACILVTPEGRCILSGKLISSKLMLEEKKVGELSFRAYSTKPEAMKAAAGRAMDIIEFEENTASSLAATVTKDSCIFLTPRYCWEEPWKDSYIQFSKIESELSTIYRAEVAEVKKLLRHYGKL